MQEGIDKVRFQGNTGCRNARDPARFGGDVIKGIAPWWIGD